jgi:hypothetical protein
MVRLCYTFKEFEFSQITFILPCLLFSIEEIEFINDIINFAWEKLKIAKQMEAKWLQTL